MADTVCKSKGAAMAALETIAGVLSGTQREVLKAITKWIDENVTDLYFPNAMMEKLKKIFKETEAEQNGREWVTNELHNPAYIHGEKKKDGRVYHKRFNEPKDGAELRCFWSAITKAWEPCEFWPPVSHQQAHNPQEDADG